jgi:hypothetical protein
MSPYAYTLGNLGECNGPTGLMCNLGPDCASLTAPERFDHSQVGRCRIPPSTRAQRTRWISQARNAPPTPYEELHKIVRKELV